MDSNASLPCRKAVTATRCQGVETEAGTTMVHPGGKPTNTGAPMLQAQEIKRGRGIEEDHTIPTIDERIEDQAEGPSRSVRDEHFIGRTDSQAMIGQQLLGDGLAQLW